VADATILRRPAPTIDAVRGQIGPDVAVQLVIRPTLAVPELNTVLAAQPPRTVVPGAIRSYGQGSSGLTGLLQVIGSPAREPATVLMATGQPAGGQPTSGQPGSRTLAAGEVVTLALPDAPVDTVAAARPVLTVIGTARITALRGDGQVVDDHAGTGNYPVPVGTALIAVQADGTVVPTGGLAGWHAATRLCALGSHAALGPGCVITSDGIPTTQGVTWMTAASLVAGAASVVTRFSAGVRSVALVVEAGAADRLAGVEFDLAGARRTRNADGSLVAPTVVHFGAQAVVIYPVEPVSSDRVSAARVSTDRGAGVATGVTVGIRSGGDWLVTGVLAGDLAVADAVNLVVRSGVAGAAGALLTPTSGQSATGSGCQLQWRDAPPVPKPSPPANPLTAAPNLTAPGNPTNVAPTNWPGGAR
jgi:hypothetical protein